MSASSSPLTGKPIVKGFFEKRTSSVQYVIADPETKCAAIIDPVLDFDPKSGATATHSAISSSRTSTRRVTTWNGFWTLILTPIIFPRSVT